MQDARQFWTNKWEASLVAQWLERPTGIWEAMGSIPIGDSDFFFVPRSWQINISSFNIIKNNVCQAVKIIYSLTLGLLWGKKT